LPTRGQANIWFSPTGKYLVYFDAERSGNYFSYDVMDNRLVNISKGVKPWQLCYKDYLMHEPEKKEFAAGIAKWLDADSGILVYDNFDIWKLDLTGNRAPINFTNGYGQKNNIIFNLMNSGQLESIRDDVNTFCGNDTIVLRAFNKKNKFNGFFKKSLHATGDPELLYMGPCLISRPFYRVNGLSIGMIPLQAADTTIWVIKRETTTDAPNYFLTADFRQYKRLTNYQPQLEYNWLTTELHAFKELNGNISHGILYKPENFDATKKYPVVISFYSHLSDRLYQFPQAAYLISPSIFDNPSWMVSHEYLVFTPDIFFSPGQWGPSVINSLDGAAKYLSKLPYVDSKRIGAAGHSNSGRFGYYLFTHSKSFAAMSLGSGASGTDIISSALSVESGLSNLEFVEKGTLGGGLGMLWDNKNKWIDHTAVLQVDKAVSPLLLFHCKNDGDPISLAMELFVSLRRIEKKVWWLNYNGGGHILTGPRELKDFTIRYTQFYDHYLKSAPAPVWMTKGIPAKLKGVESRYELDGNGSCGINCKICNSQKEILLNSCLGEVRQKRYRK